MAYKVKVKAHRSQRGGKTFKVKGYSRKSAETKVGQIEVAGKKVKVTESKNYIHYVINPKAKGTTRILDIGKPKKHELVRVKTDSGWVTRSVRVQKGVRTSPSETRSILKKAILYQQ